MVKIDKGKKPRKPKKLKKHTYDFDKMSPGDSFHYEGARSAAIVAFGYWAIKGFFSTEKEGDGWRFYMLDNPIKDRKERKS